MVVSVRFLVKHFKSLVIYWLTSSAGTHFEVHLYTISSVLQPLTLKTQPNPVVLWHKSKKQSFIFLHNALPVWVCGLVFFFSLPHRTCGSRGRRTRQPTNFPASCAGSKSNQCPRWVWRRRGGAGGGCCVPGSRPNQMRSRSLAQRQSMWFVHLSRIDGRVEVGVPLPRLRQGTFPSACPRGPPSIPPALLKRLKIVTRHKHNQQQLEVGAGGRVGGFGTVDFPAIELPGLLHC